MADPLMRSVFRLADRLHKLPDEILAGFTYEQFQYYAAHLRLLDEERDG